MPTQKINDINVSWKIVSLLGAIIIIMMGWLFETLTSFNKSLSDQQTVLVIQVTKNTENIKHIHKRVDSTTYDIEELEEHH